jgi:hypothetical protein
MRYPSRGAKYLPLLPAMLAIIAQTAVAQPQGQAGALKYNLEPTQRTLEVEARGARDIARARPTRQEPGRTYEALARLPFQKDVTRVKYRVSSTGEAVFEGDMILGDADEV